MLDDREQQHPERHPGQAVDRERALVAPDATVLKKSDLAQPCSPQKTSAGACQNGTESSAGRPGAAAARTAGADRRRGGADSWRRLRAGRLEERLERAAVDAAREPQTKKVAAA